MDTEADRVLSVRKIRDALVELASRQEPLDILAVSGDGTLDNHVLVAAYWAFFPDLVKYRAGTIDCSAVGPKDLETIPSDWRKAFFATLPDGKDLDPDENTVKQIWLLRSQLEPLLRKGRKAARIIRKTRREANDNDTLLRISILATLFPQKVALRSHGFDLAGLAEAERDNTFQGLYSHVRCISFYPAGTAADNAVFAGTPGWAYGLFAGLLHPAFPFSPRCAGV